MTIKQYLTLKKRNDYIVNYILFPIVTTIATLIALFLTNPSIIR